MENESLKGLYKFLHNKYLIMRGLYRSGVKLCKSKEGLGKFIGDFLGYCFLYGVIINFTVWRLGGYKFSILNIFAWGALVYLIKEEFPVWLNKLMKFRIERKNIPQKIMDE